MVEWWVTERPQQQQFSRVRIFLHRISSMCPLSPTLMFVIFIFGEMWKRHHRRRRQFKMKISLDIFHNAKSHGMACWVAYRLPLRGSPLPRCNYESLHVPREIFPDFPWHACHRHRVVLVTVVEGEIKKSANASHSSRFRVGRRATRPIMQHGPMSYLMDFPRSIIIAEEGEWRRSISSEKLWKQIFINRNEMTRNCSAPTGMTSYLSEACLLLWNSHFNWQILSIRLGKTLDLNSDIETKKMSIERRE